MLSGSNHSEFVGKHRRQVALKQICFTKTISNVYRMRSWSRKKSQVTSQSGINISIALKMKKHSKHKKPDCWNSVLNSSRKIAEGLEVVFEPDKRYKASSGVSFGKLHRVSAELLATHETRCLPTEPVPMKSWRQLGWIEIAFHHNCNIFNAFSSYCLPIYLEDHTSLILWLLKGQNSRRSNWTMPACVHLVERSDRSWPPLAGKQVALNRWPL